MMKYDYYLHTSNYYLGLLLVQKSSNIFGELANFAYLSRYIYIFYTNLEVFSFRKLNAWILADLPETFTDLKK